MLCTCWYANECTKLEFATDLVGTRSPYGRPASSFNPLYASGGSSSGSAVLHRADMAS